MPNPIYADDPDFYERPGEVVDLPVLIYNRRHVMPRLPWQPDRFDGVTPRYFTEVASVRSKDAPKQERTVSGMREAWER